jgi:hypothetical protein
MNFNRSIVLGIVLLWWPALDKLNPTTNCKSDAGSKPKNCFTKLSSHCLTHALGPSLLRTTTALASTNAFIFYGWKLSREVRYQFGCATWMRMAGILQHMWNTAASYQTAK